MSANLTLDRLVSQMSIEERLGLLEKIRNNSTISFEPLYVPNEDDDRRVNFEEQYRILPWFIRLFYHIVGLFTGKSAAKVYENGQILQMGRAIEVNAPGVFDCQNNRLLNVFFLSLVELKDAARFFYTVLDTGINKDRGAFYAVLGSLEMEDIHRLLQNECNPHAITESVPDILPANVRQAVLRTMDETLQSISDSQRGIMYYHARSLNYLRELSCFLFDRLTLAFESTSTGHRCQINASVKELLLGLDNILFSLRDTPALSLFESLFVYELETRAGEPGFDMDKEMKSLLSQAERALATIRNFNTKIPLTRIIRCVSRNTEYSPAQISGGEEWFQVYRNYWKQQTENALNEYFLEKKHQDIVRTLEAFFGATPEPLANVASDTNSEGFPLPEAFTLSFLKAFNSVIVGSMHKVMRPILMDGEFAKREDRLGLTEAYNDLVYAADHIRDLDAKIAPTGEYGKRYLLAKNEKEALMPKRRKMQYILNEASKEAWDIILRSCEGMKKVSGMLDGILNKDLGDKNSGISNFDKLAGRNPAGFSKKITEVIENLQQALQLLNDIGTIGKMV